MKLLVWLRDAIANNPTRIHSWPLAMFCVTCFYVPSLRDDPEIWLQFAGAILFGGELVRQAVTPSRKLRGTALGPPPANLRDQGAAAHMLILGLLLGIFGTIVPWLPGTLR